MILAILSDTHDHIVNTRIAIDLCNTRGATVLLHCGDLISPFMLQELSSFHGPIHLVYGNNVGDQHLIANHCSTLFPAITHHNTVAYIEAAGLKIVMHHYPHIARNIAAAGNFDIVCCGHNHTWNVETIGSTLLINPGELLGKDNQPSFALLDTEKMQVEKILVGEKIADRQQR